MPQSASVEQVPASPPASPTPELPLDPEDTEAPLNPELSPAASLEPELLPDPLPLPEPKPLPLDDGITSSTPASPFPLFEPELPQPAERPTRAVSVVSLANVVPSHSVTTLS